MPVRHGRKGQLLVVGAFREQTAAACREGIEEHEYLEPFEGREYRFVVRRRSNAVVSAHIPNDEEPDASDLRGVLDAAERCLSPA
jgi:hypothetical protein